MSRHYPVALIIEARPCLVVGAGRVAEGRLAALLEAGARVLVVAPEATPRIRQLAAEGGIELQLRQATADDLAGVRLALVATDDAALNARLAREAARRGVPVNVADAPELCDFHVPAVLRRGPLTVAVATGGACPALAAHLRREIGRVVGEEHGALAALMGELRPRLKQRWPDRRERIAAWERLMASQALELLRRGRRDEARRVAAAQLQLDSDATEPPD